MKRCICAAPLLVLSLLSRPAAARDPERVEWSADWPRFRLAETIGLVPLAATSLTFAFVLPPPEKPHWRGGILFDDWVRNRLSGKTASVQHAFSNITDGLYYGSVPIPLIVDIGIVTLGIHRNTDVALQELLIDMQALGMSGVVALGGERLVARQRPYAGDCDAQGQQRSPSGALLHSCGTADDNESFFAGHAATVATMAGLTCVHHQHLPLYGGGVADLAPCLFMIGAASVTGVGRMVADQHWASDVLLGWSLGAVSGYVVPSLLHYGFGRGHAVGVVRSGSMLAVPVPLLFPAGAGLGMVGFL